LPQAVIDWNNLESQNRVWLGGDVGDHKAWLEFLAERGLRLICADFDKQNAVYLHFSNPADRETLHIKAARGPDVLKAAAKSFPEANRWLQIFGVQEAPIFTVRPDGILFHKDGNLMEAEAGRLLGVYEIACEWPRGMQGRKPAQVETCFSANRGDFLAKKLAFLQALEEARAIKLPAAACVARAVLLEQERIRCHLLWLGDMAEVVSRNGMSGRCRDFLEKQLCTTEAWLGPGQPAAWCVPGGLREDFPRAGLRAAGEANTELFVEWKRMEKECLALPLPEWLNGRLSSLKGRARGQGWVGPLARAAGMGLDARAEEAGAFLLLDWIPAQAQHRRGILPRLLEIKVLEITSSLEAVAFFLTEFPEGPLLKKRGGGGKGEGFGRVEGPAGEVTCHLRLEKGIIAGIAFSLPAELNRTAARSLIGAWLDEMELASLAWRSA
jgi:Ni,Fe-hydrogenase III large subunit